LGRIAGQSRPATAAPRVASAANVVGPHGVPEFRNPEGLLEALGGASNVQSVTAYGSRLRLQLRDHSLASEAGVLQNGFRGLVRLEDGVAHVLAQSDARQIAEVLHSVLNRG
ncbi:MAG TPA: PTS transporter subunit EIIB, partial [Woeseiaceae bacterium]|nr:PTS transporter subunit EIIB [Woeseiaceae bacterium]